MYHMGSFTYEAQILQPSMTFDGAMVWHLFADLFPDIDALLALTEARLVWMFTTGFC